MGSPEDEFRAALAEARRRERAAADKFAQGIGAEDGDLVIESLQDLALYGGGASAFRKAIRHGGRSAAFRERMLGLWLTNGDDLRDSAPSDLLLIDLLRVVLPPYAGAPLTLYRGDSARNRKRRTYGMSWTTDESIAQAFAHGYRDIYMGGTVVLKTVAPPDAIICAPAEIDNRYEEAEYVVDRRRLYDVRVIERLLPTKIQG